MIYLGNDSWGYTVAESRELLFAIFPNYPDTNPCHQVPEDMYPPDSPKCKFPKVRPGQ